MLLPLDCRTAETGELVNGGQCPFILTVDMGGRLCHLEQRSLRTIIVSVLSSHNFEKMLIVTYNPLSYMQQPGNILYMLSNYGGKLRLDIQKEFGLRIQQLRKGIGMSQEKFALSIDMDRTYLASIESGKRNPSLQNIKKIADGLGISLSDMFREL